MTQYITKLPAVFQTVTEKKFFDATFDQVFSKKDSDYLAGYIGRRDPGGYNPVTDFYLPEPTKNRTWWQLEATAFARNADSTKSNVFFYEDLLERIEYFGGNTLNQDRLFASEYYSFGPPIDYDMFINYQNYFWVEQGLATIAITGVNITGYATLDEYINAEVIGKSSYTTQPTASPANLTFTTGLNVSFVGSTTYETPRLVENFGGCIGIKLIEKFSDITSGSIFELLPWDGEIELANGRLISNLYWDATTWETQTHPGTSDYLTIERGALDQNAWSRTNKWFHVDAISATIASTNSAFPVNATRALRPIIQFVADIPLYKSGTQFREEIEYGFRDNANGNPILLSDLQRRQLADINIVYGTILTNGDLVSFFNDDTEISISNYPWDTFNWDMPPANHWDEGTPSVINKYIFKANVELDGTVYFSPYTSWETPIIEGDIVFITEDAPYNGAQRGSTWYYSNGVWDKVNNDKVKINQAPLFVLRDHNGVELDDETTYPGSTFTGSKIFSYKVNSAIGATIDPVLKFPIVYTSLGQSSDIMFQNNLITDRYTYSSARIGIDGYYYYKTTQSPVLYNNWNLYQPCPCPVGNSENYYEEYIAIAGQRVINTSAVKTVAADSGHTFLMVSLNGVLQVEGTSFVVSGINQIEFNTPLAVNDKVAVYAVAPATVCGTCVEVSKQRVIDKYVVGYGSEYQFLLSVTPYGYPTCADIIVTVNSQEVKSASAQANGYGFTVVNDRIYVDLSSYLTTLLTVSQKQPPVVEIQTYTHGLLAPASTGYSSIPQQLEANPSQLEVSEISASNLIDHFSSIISNQAGIVGASFGRSNNYRDTQKNRSVGSFILQNTTPLLKTMLVSSSTDLDFITAARYSQDEYTKFKNKYLQTALQMINRGFNPVQYHNNTIVVSAWVDEILKIVNVSREFSNAFAYSYMIASGSAYATESIIVTSPGLVSLTEYLDLSDQKNALYVYDTTGHETLLVIGRDYEIVSTNLSIELQINISNIPVGSNLTIAMYKNALPAYIPSTPTKIGAYATFVPRVELDATYMVPTNVIIGHDGSKTIAYGDYRDQLLLELETRIYNLLQYKFRHQYNVPLRVESVKTGFFRKTRYTRDEYLDVTDSYLNKWSARNRANYRSNDWDSASVDASVVQSFAPGIGNVWKLYNYTDAINTAGEALDLPGNWKGVFQYYYDTYNPDTCPWAMLGFSEQPSWWQFEYGAPVINLAGQEVWTSNASGNSNMYLDLEAGIIRQGPSAIYNPLTLSVQPQKMWARPGLSAIIPVTSAGEIVSVMDLFDITFSGNYLEPFDHYNDDWVYGDGAPVEQAWMSTSAYAFSVQEFLYLMRPAPYGELMWDTIGTTLSPGMILVPTSTDLVQSNNNWQYVQSDTSGISADFVSWMRPKNSSQLVHAESVDGNIQIKFGYQRWISDRILFLGADVAEVFGQKIRTLDVNLANKVAGFTNKDTTNTYIESITPGSSTSGLIIPATNYNVMLHKSPPVDTYSYSGVVIRALTDGTFAVYGYDLINSEFRILNRNDVDLIDVSIGGTPSPFVYFAAGATYAAGDIVRYNGVYYSSNVSQTVQKFEVLGFDKLPGLPTTGGISVTYRPVSGTIVTKIPYGSILKTPQEVFDFLIGWGAYLESQGWQFGEVNQDTNLISDWLASAKQYLFWLNSEWAPDASIQLSPSANKAVLEVSRGYPQDVETISNGVYSILDKFGVAIPPNGTTTNRDGRLITVEPANLAAGGIFYLQVNATETEHVMIFDNTTSFNDVVFSPLLRARQQRLRFNGFRSNGWHGKMEAPGYIIIEDQLVPNFDTMVEAMRYYYDPNTTIDNSSLEDLGRHLIGYESKSYLDNLQVSNDVQYLFYRGAIRQKGTIQSFEKLFRSTKVQNEEIIEVYEEWALKLSDFGNTVEQVSTEIILQPEQNTGEVIVARLNYVPSKIGYVKLINVLNATDRYLKVPQIRIAAPDANQYDPALTGPLRQARAYAVLDAAGRISRIDIADGGYGYITSPRVTVVASLPDVATSDLLYSVWQGEIISDSTLDNVVNIDIDDTAKWIVRPTDTQYSLEFPVTDNIVYPMPNAGYVNFNDVNWSIFDVSQAAITWGTSSFNPSEFNTVWVANTFTEDWDVYKLINLVSAPYLANTWKVVADENNNLILLTDPGVTIIPQMWDSPVGNRTDFGNMIVLQEIINGVANVNANYTLAFAPYSSQNFNNPGTYTDPDTLVLCNAYSLLTLDGTPVTAEDIGEYLNFTDLLLFKTMRWHSKPSEPYLPTYVGVEDLIWVDDVAGKWAVFKIQAKPGFWDVNKWDPQIVNFWGPNYGWDVSGPLFFNPHRVQEPLINSALFESANVFSPSPSSALAQLPVYDPFKNILPGVAKQNITYTSLRDPARYNVAGDVTLYNSTVTFGPQQVGKLWWDLSSAKYVYYEQPITVDGSETAEDNLKYRRDRWGQLFPGSKIAIYEWVVSPVPPNEYTGTGTPRDTSTYVRLNSTNRFTNTTTVKYYFWVLNATDLPNVENRTLAALDVSRILETPKSRGFVFFAPIQQTSTNNSYMFYNVQEILAYTGNNVQIQYRLSERDDQEHTQWAFFREGDVNSIVANQFWNKMVDSICAYTKVLPVSPEYSGINISDYDKWGSTPYDTIGWDLETTYGEILPVPNPALSESEKYGILYRPRQGMFANITAARKVFVQSANNLLQHIAIRDNNPAWNANVPTSIYWSYTNWYAVGYENVTPTVVFKTLAEAVAATTAGQVQVGDILQVTSGTIDGRFVLYAVMQVNANIPVLSLDEVAVENSAIKLLDTIYTLSNRYDMSIELRSLLAAFRSKVMVNLYKVDQNELFFSLMNYVVSEQKNPDWLFKTSYIYIKENNLPLLQSRLYVPDQIDSVIGYINDTKPYHTHIRDYTSTYVTTDIAAGTASDTYKIATTIAFGPAHAGKMAPGHWDAMCNDSSAAGAWDTYGWDVCYPATHIFAGSTFADNVLQFISQEDVYTVPLTMFDASKIGLSALYPYTFNFDSINLNNPQTFVAPSNIVGVQIGENVLIYGRDYYVEFNQPSLTFTVYFYNDPGTTHIPVALVWVDGGGFQHFKFNTSGNEVAHGFSTDNLVVNIDTKLAVNNINGVYSVFSDSWDATDPTVKGIVAVLNPPPVDPFFNSAGFDNSHWDQNTLEYMELLNDTLSSKENVNTADSVNFYRNASVDSGVLVNDLPAPTADTDNISIIRVSASSDIYQTPRVNSPGVIWINGERIEYLAKVAVTTGVWDLKLVRRGTMGTTPSYHAAMVPEIALPLGPNSDTVVKDPQVLTPNKVWVESDNQMQDGANIAVWNARDSMPAPLSETSTGVFTNVASVPLGGLWYSQTEEAMFLKMSTGRSLP